MKVSAMSDLEPRIEVRVHGYDYGSKPQWIPATFVRYTPKCVEVRFQLKNGVTLQRRIVNRHVRRIGHGAACKNCVALTDLLRDAAFYVNGTSLASRRLAKAIGNALANGLEEG